MSRAKCIKDVKMIPFLFLYPVSFFLLFFYFFFFFNFFHSFPLINYFISFIFFFLFLCLISTLSLRKSWNYFDACFSKFSRWVRCYLFFSLSFLPSFLFVLLPLAPSHRSRRPTTPHNLFSFSWNFLLLSRMRNRNNKKTPRRSAKKREKKKKK